MTVDTELQLLTGQGVMAPRVSIGGQPLPPEIADRLVRVVVDQHVSLPDTFELAFLDPELDVLTKAGLKLGAEVVVAAGSRGSNATTDLIQGEVTTLEGAYGSRGPLTRVVGCTMEHRLQRARRVRTFVNAKDSDVARKIAQEAGIDVGTIDATSQTHPLLAQENQTDWEFLRSRAEEIGYDLGVSSGKLHFRKASDAGSGSPVQVTPGIDLVSFIPRVSSAGLVPEVEVRAWDVVNAQAKSAKAKVRSATVSIGAGDAAAAAQVFAKAGAGGAAGSGELGPLPSPQAHVVFDRAVTVEGGNVQALSDAAGALAERAASGYAEAEGEVLGDAKISAGCILKVDRVPREFAGSWTVTRARHVFDHNTGNGYRTLVTASGRQDRSLFSLSSASVHSGNNRGPTRLPGIAVGVVSDVDDPLGLARVKVTLAWLSPEYETSWAPVVQLSAGKANGAVFLPEPGEAVLVGFEFGDLRRPYVLGSVVNKRTGAGGCIEPGAASPGKAAVKAGRPAAVIRRGLITPSGNRLVFHDEVPPSGGEPMASQIVLATASDKVGLLLDQVAGTLTLSCKPGSPPGRLVVECDGDVEIKAGASGRLTIDGGQMLSLKGKTVQIEGTGPVAVKGKPIQLN